MNHPLTVWIFFLTFHWIFHLKIIFLKFAHLYLLSISASGACFHMRLGSDAGPSSMEDSDRLATTCPPQLTWQPHATSATLLLRDPRLFMISGDFNHVTLETLAFAHFHSYIFLSLLSFLFHIWFYFYSIYYSLLTACWAIVAKQIPCGAQ